MDDLKTAIRKIFGENVEIEEKRPVSGGDINDSFRLLLSDGNSVFMKTNRKKKADFFLAEANGLLALSDMGAINVAEVLCVGADTFGPFLLLKYIESARETAAFWEDFGHSLARLHLADASEYSGGRRFGFHEDNYIGATKQVNTPCDSWVEFYREYRLRPQLRAASFYFDHAQRRKAEALLDRLSQYVPEPEVPSPLHGDLWSGNFMTDHEGRPVLIDPAAFVGSSEADIAMTELFGGFSSSFYRAYYETNPLQPGYEDRRELYQLYHLLNHLNLFGRSYLPSVSRIVERYAG